ncbi:hypothetical protein HXP45_28970 [Streptomyces actuosus]|nr:hypothetical protein [Streptomyces actuosus]
MPPRGRRQLRQLSLVLGLSDGRLVDRPDARLLRLLQGPLCGRRLLRGLHLRVRHRPLSLRDALLGVGEALGVVLGGTRLGG